MQIASDWRSKYNNYPKYATNAAKKWSENEGIQVF